MRGAVALRFARIARRDDTMRRSTPRVQKNVPPVELNSPSCQALIHCRANQGDQRINLFKWWLVRASSCEVDPPRASMLTSFSRWGGSHMMRETAARNAGRAHLSFSLNLASLSMACPLVRPQTVKQVKRSPVAATKLALREFL